MYAIIAGAGKVGRNLARELISKEHEVTLIESSRGCYLANEEEFEHALQYGDATELWVLERAGILMILLLLFLLLTLAACALVLGFLRKSAPPQVRFTQVKRQTVVSTVPTNGKVEPYEWQAVHAETAGLAARVDVQARDHALEVHSASCAAASVNRPS